MKKNNSKGQTLVMLLVFMLVAIIVTSASISLVINSSMATDKLYQGASALTVAESGAETAMIKLLRDSSYTGEVLDVNNGQAEITVTGTEPKVVVSVGTFNNFTRTIQVTVSTLDNTLTVTSWREI